MSGSSNFFPKNPSLLSGWNAFQKAVDPLIKATSFEPKIATERSEELYKIAKNYRSAIFEDKSAKTLTQKQLSKEERTQILYEKQKAFQKALIEKNIPFPMILKALEILSSQEVQCFDQLKCSLSKTSRIFLELFIYKCSIEKRHIYKSTVTDIQKQLKKVLSTLPKKEVETRFALQCSAAATKKLEPGKGKWTEVVRDHRSPIAKGIAEMALSASPTSINLSVLVSPLVDLSVRIYKEIEEKWYKDIWALSWHGAENVPDETAFNHLSPFLEDADKHKYLAQQASYLFMQIIQSPEADLKLKRRVFEGNFPSLLTLSQIEKQEIKLFGKITLRKDPFWRVRYVTIKHLATLVKEKDPNFEKASLRKLAARFHREKHPYLDDLLSSTILGLIYENQDKQPIKSSDIDGKIKKSQSREQEVDEKIRLYNKNLVPNRRKLNTTTRGDGACAIHALLGKKIKNEYVFYSPKPTGDVQRDAKDHFVNAFQEAVKQAHFKKEIIDCLDEYFSRESKDYRSLIAGLDLSSSQKQDLYSFYVQVLDSPEIDKELFELLRKAASATKGWDKLEDQELAQQLKKDQKQCLDAFEPVRKQVFSWAKEKGIKALDATKKNLRKFERSRDKTKRNYLLEHRSKYFAGIKPSSYYLTDNELKLASLLFNKQVTLISRGTKRTIGSSTGEEVTILHEGLHYSRIDSSERQEQGTSTQNAQLTKVDRDEYAKHEKLLYLEKEGLEAQQHRLKRLKTMLEKSSNALSSSSSSNNN
ncbi:hypothetical protein [Candidatus Neptunochlamydia vexilliferae]|uniref:OTU domain-containing protein n=1 Tax=Candidatus Neptunichlamydia vexilliferae TaxID=1651774 RepID=A0ABS0AY34_9BACT|nr:hypothetical protein [Candidatus Neptunochlamydia vexilliferae]MBF5059044.1 hypothetical protein [Candidatus Neptunochlamydia vexilliferae]